MAGLGQGQARAERLLALTAVLRRGWPVTFAELRERHRLYPGDHDTARRAFERDKATLRESGVLLVHDDGDDTYLVARASAATITWSDTELDTLAVLATAIGDDATATALGKLSAGSGQFPADVTSARIDAAADLPAGLSDAIRGRLRVTLTYRNAKDEVRRRTIEPWDLQFRKGLLYVTAWDPEASIEKHFRIDRIEGAIRTAGPATHDRPDAPLPLPYPVERHDVLLLVDPSLRHDAVSRGGTVMGTRDGRLEVAFTGVRLEPIVGWALRVQAHVESPHEVSSVYEERLAKLVEVHTGPPSEVAVPTPTRSRRASLSSTRLQRLMALPTWLAERGGATVVDIATAFSCPVEEVEVDIEVLESIDIPGIGQLGEVRRVGDQLDYKRWVEEPSVDLTSDDALRLLLMVEIARTVLVDDEAAGLDAIAARLREIAPSEIAVQLAGQLHPDLDLLRSAIAEGSTVRFQYKGRRDRDWRDREVRPEQLMVFNGSLYVTGIDVIIGEERKFRLDRLTDVVESGSLPALAAEQAAPAYVAVDEEVEAVMRLTTRATWLLTQIAPDASEATDDGGAVIVVRTDTPDWLLAHVRAAGGEAEVIAPQALRDRLATVD